MVQQDYCECSGQCMPARKVSRHPSPIAASGRAKATRRKGAVSFRTPAIASRRHPSHADQARPAASNAPRRPGSQPSGYAFGTQMRGRHHRQAKKEPKAGERDQAERQPSPVDPGEPRGGAYADPGKPAESQCVTRDPEQDGNAVAR